ncbi:zinc finger protein 2 homolog [Aedes aegypti]|uniref:C2H2-type domain-containing protein n=1 Tax=Aedes aegypti TaxID=7159 RepID=A0A6I8U2B7_AEDAE|nr:zinc finger protein 2 homolog [Aedes aegypti]
MNTLYLVYVPHTVDCTPAVQLSTLEYATVEIVNGIRVPLDGPGPVASIQQQQALTEENVVQQQMKFGRKPDRTNLHTHAPAIDPNKEFQLRERLLKDNWVVKDDFVGSIEIDTRLESQFHSPLGYFTSDRLPKIIEDTIIEDSTSSIDEGIGLSATDDSGDDQSLPDDNNNSHHKNSNNLNPERKHDCHEEDEDEVDGRDINFALIKSKKKRKASDNKSYKCEICEELFPKKKLLRDHLAVQHPGQSLNRCHICGKTFKLRSNLRQHSRIHTGERPFRCDICGKTFVQGSALTVHKELHKDKKEHQCDVCKKDFKSKFAFKKHEKVHKGLRPFICDVCGKSFTQSCNLKAHLQLHNGTHAFKCSTCFKTFRFKSHYEDHLMTHTKDKKYTCSKCGRNFAYKNSYQRHMQHIHRDESPHQCTVCSKTFVKLSHLTFHKKSHRKAGSLICEICGLVFEKETTFAKHNETVHREEEEDQRRLFKCVICSKSFEEESELTTHFMLHEADDCPFQCGMCGILNLSQA